jgi:uncharacterized protein (TIGR02300 family)
LALTGGSKMSMGPATHFSNSLPFFGICRKSGYSRGLTVAKPELGTKRVCPETGRKFYDLNKDPVVSPYTGKSYPLSFFEETKVIALMEKEEQEEVAEVDPENTEVELVSLEDADDEVAGTEDIPDLDDDDVEIGDDDDTFLAADEDEDDDDVSGIIGVNSDDDEV